MANFIQRASDSISGFGQSYEKFSKQLLIEQYSPGSIKSYSHKLAAISFHFKKLPEHLSEEDCRDYFSMLLSRTPSPGLSYFKHTVYSLRCYRKTMHLSELNFSLPRIRSTKKLPVVLSQSEVISLLVIGGSAIYCIVKALWQSLLILVVLGIATIAAVFLLVWAVMKAENIGESLGAFIRS